MNAALVFCSISSVVLANINSSSKIIEGCCLIIPILSHFYFVSCHSIPMLLCNLSFYHFLPSTFRSLSFCDSVVLSIFCSVTCDIVTSLLCHSVTLLFHHFFSLPHCCFDSLPLVTLSPCCFAILFYHFFVLLLRHFLTLLLFHLCFFATCRSVALLVRLSFTLSLFHFITLTLCRPHRVVSSFSFTSRSHLLALSNHSILRFLRTLFSSFVSASSIWMLVATSPCCFATSTVHPFSQ